MSNAEKFPPEIMEEILYRLPAKSVGRFKCVSKPYQSLISKPQFVKTHINRNIHRCDHEKLTLLSDDHSLYSLDVDGDLFLTNTAAGKELVFRPQIRWETIYSSCHGLILAADQDDNAFLINPATLQSSKIPTSPFALDFFQSETIHGFGHDSITEDYKIVTISYYRPETELGADCADMFVDVYSLKNNFWKRVQNSVYDHSVSENVGGVFLNGSLHWPVIRTAYSSAIAAFSLENEGFGEVSLPSLVDVERAVFYKLGVLGGCLSMVEFPKENQTGVWIMKEYGVEDSWTKIFICETDNRSRFRALSLIGDWEGILLEKDEEEVVVYNVDERRLRSVDVHGIPRGFQVGGIYVESIVSPQICQP